MIFTQKHPEQASNRKNARGPLVHAQNCRKIVLRECRRFGSLTRQFSDTLLGEQARETIQQQDAKTLAHTFGVPTDSQKLILPPPSPLIIPAWRSIVATVAEGSRRLTELDWREFEDLMSEVLERSGWHVRPMGYTKDGGIDIVAVRTIAPDIPIQMMVQCKRNAPSRPVQIAVVREVWSVKWQHGFHQAMIATTSGFSKGAKRQADEWELDLKDSQQIIQWCQRLHVGELIST